jgi:hypothetical protein
MEEEKPRTNNSNNSKLKIRICPHCKQSYKTEIGLQNWKNLFKKPTAEDWISLIILILLFLAAFAYVHDTKVCRETLNNLDTICAQRAMGNSMNTTNILITNLSFKSTKFDNITVTNYST